MVQILITEAGDPEWNRMIDAMNARIQELVGVIVLASRTAGPTPKQRALLNTVLRNTHRLRVAIVNDSILARGVLTAINWLAPAATGLFQEVFPRSDLDKAIAFLELEAKDESDVRDLIRQFTAIS